MSRYFQDGTSFHVGQNPTAMTKAIGDASLTAAGYTLVDLPGGCEIENE